MSRPCLDCGLVSAGARCPAHQRRREAARAPHRAAYDNPAYRAARRAMKGRPCIYCGRPSDTVEHLVSLSAGGANDETNWAPACRSCNSSKGSRQAPPTQSAFSPHQPEIR